MNFTIYSIGDAEFMEQVLNALAMVSGTQDFTVMVRIGLLIGVFSTILSAISNGGRGIEMHHVFLGYILWATMFVPTAKVTIEDVYTSDVRAVNNVPIGPAAAGGIISTIGLKLTELFEVAYNPVIPRVTENRYLESLKLLSDIRNIAGSGTIWQAMNLDAGGGFIDLRQSWINYIKDCTLKKVDMRIMSPDQLSTEPFAKSLEFQSSFFGTWIYTLSGDNAGEYLTCSEAWNKLEPMTKLDNTYTVQALNSVLKYNKSNLKTGQTSLDKTQEALDTLLASSVNGKDYMKMAVLEPVLMQAAQGKYSKMLDTSGAMMVNQAVQQRNTSWAAEQTLFMTIVRPMLAFFESFTYAIAPIMAFVIVLGKQGIQLAGKYFTLLIWIQLWMPLLSIINLYIYVSASREMATYTSMATHNWDSFYALHEAANTMQNWVATGGLLASSTPALALMLIYGSASTATFLAGRMGSNGAIDTKYQTPDLQSNAPYANISSAYSGNTLSGLVPTGTSNFVPTVSLQQVASRIASSSSQAAETSALNFQDTLSNSIINSKNGSETSAVLKSASNMLQSNHNDATAAITDRAKQFAQKYSLNEAHTNELAGALAVVASVGGSGKSKTSSLVGTLASALAKTTNIPLAALQAVLGAELKGSYSANNKTADSSSVESGQNTSDTTRGSLNTNQNASLLRMLSGQIAKNEGTTYTDSGGSSALSTIGKSAQRAYTDNKIFSEAQNTQSSLSNTTATNLAELAGVMRHNNAAKDILNAGFASQPQPIKDKAAKLEEMYRDWGMAPEQALLTSRLSALTDPNIHQGDPDGRRNADYTVLRTMESAIGISGASPGDAHQYESLREKAKLVNSAASNAEDKGKDALPPIDTSERAKHEVDGTPFSKIPSSDVPNNELLKEDYNSNTGKVNDSAKKQTAFREQLIHAENDLINGHMEKSAVAFASGGMGNIVNAASRHIQSIYAGFKGEDRQGKLDEFKEKYTQEAHSKFGLTPEQSAIFAESFDTRPDVMQQKIQDLKMSYAEKDDNGQPRRDEATNRWILSDRNERLTDGIVNNIREATQAGGHAGSYLAPIIRYNNLNADLKLPDQKTE